MWPMRNKNSFTVVPSLAILFFLSVWFVDANLAAEPSQDNPVLDPSSGWIQLAQSAASTSKPPSPEKPHPTTGVQGRSTGLCTSPDGLPIPCTERSPTVRTRGFTSDPLAERERALQERRKALLRSLSEVEMELERLQQLRKGKTPSPNPSR